MTADYAMIAQNVRTRGLNGGGVLSFEGEVPHGQGKRAVGIHLDPLEVLELAAALLCCPGAIDEPGHAVWHLEHLSSPRPCPKKSLHATKDPDAAKRRDALAIANSERSRIVRFLEAKVGQLEGEGDKTGHAAGARAYAAGLLRGIVEALREGEHRK
jgi:hypothetical protein